MYVTLREAALLYGIPVRTMRYWVKHKKVKAYKSANGWYWMVEVTDENKDRESSGRTEKG